MTLHYNSSIKRTLIWDKVAHLSSVGSGGFIPSCMLREEWKVKPLVKTTALPQEADIIVDAGTFQHSTNSTGAWSKRDSPVPQDSDKKNLVDHQLVEEFLLHNAI
jgi:hypothetical protein